MHVHVMLNFGLLTPHHGCTTPALRLGTLVPRQKCVLTVYVVQVGHTGLQLASLEGHTDVVATLLSAPGVLVDSADNKVCAHERVGRRFVCGFIYRCW